MDIIIFILVLSVLIVVHEWGHFITAKKLGVKVEEFSLGFGPKIYSRVHNGTEYMIKLLPLGGYVRMAGDERGKCKGTPDEFFSKSVAQRALIVLNGPVVNYALAYLCLFIVFNIGHPGISAKIAEVKLGGPAFHAGLQPGDKVISLDSKKIYGLMNMQMILEGDQSSPIDIDVERNGDILSYTISPDIIEKKNLLGEDSKFRDFGIGFYSNVVGGLSKDSPAKMAGILDGDLIIQINDRSISNWTDIQNAVRESTDEVLKIHIIREDATLSFDVEPIVKEVEDENGEKINIRLIGIGPEQELDLTKFGPIESFQYAGEELWFITGMTFRAIGAMVTGSKSAREEVAGPIGIFLIIRNAAREGIAHLLFIVGLVSASLAIFNLLPIIPLDGGHIFLLGIEGIRKRPLPPKIEDIINRIGFGLIMCLVVYVFAIDISRLELFQNVKGLFVK